MANSTTTPSPDAEREAGKPPMPAFDYADQWAADTLYSRGEFQWGERNLARSYQAAIARAAQAEAARDELRAERDAALAREARLREALERIVRANQYQHWTATDGKRESQWVIMAGPFASIAATALTLTSEPQPAAEGE